MATRWAVLSDNDKTWDEFNDLLQRYPLPQASVRVQYSSGRQLHESTRRKSRMV